MIAEATLSADSGFERSLYSIFVPFPVVCFVGAFATDLAYWGSASFIWETFSVWLLATGLVMAGVTVLAGIVDLLVKRRFHIGMVRAVCAVLIVLLSLVNVFVHSRDGYTAVVPTGITLSGIVVALLVVTAAIGRTIVTRTSIARIR
ncbi:MAG: DUF2231 domain-containing protein [Tardiphaga sp.]